MHDNVKLKSPNFLVFLLRQISKVDVITVALLYLLVPLLIMIIKRLLIKKSKGEMCTFLVIVLSPIFSS